MGALKVLWAFAATRASTGYALAIIIATIAGGWYLYDSRGDDIADLKLKLSACEGNPAQAATIRRLTDRLNEIQKDKANDQISELESLPNDCYELDGPSPLNGVRSRRP